MSEAPCWTCLSAAAQSDLPSWPSRHQAGGPEFGSLKGQATQQDGKQHHTAQSKKHGILDVLLEPGVVHQAGGGHGQPHFLALGVSRAVVALPFIPLRRMHLHVGEDLANSAWHGTSRCSRRSVTLHAKIQLVWVPDLPLARVGRRMAFAIPDPTCDILFAVQRLEGDGHARCRDWMSLASRRVPVVAQGASAHVYDLAADDGARAPQHVGRQPRGLK
mmetsp:Transcript_71547/g.205272  ORF Transcript_71547/g.205272 Transcript_71547/m.205272 type:complete len:218 (+) Transcript_71547:18-671(+)